MFVDLRESWWIRDVEIPTRVVLAPMAGVSVQAFRRQGRRFGAGLVCSEMVSCAGIEHKNERTLGYLRVAADEHPLAIQIFGSEPRAMAEAASLAAERLHADARHRREHEPGRHLDRVDEPAFPEVDLHGAHGRCMPFAPVAPRQLPFTTVLTPDLGLRPVPQHPGGLF